MKLLTAFTLAFLLFTTFLFSQSNTFRLGFTGAYPNYSHILLNSPTYNSDWNWYDEFTMNTWSAWWVGDTAQTVFGRLSSHSLYLEIEFRI